jgi:hypothetical protein
MAAAHHCQSERSRRPWRKSDGWGRSVGPAFCPPFSRNIALRTKCFANGSSRKFSPIAKDTLARVNARIAVAVLTQRRLFTFQDVRINERAIIILIAANSANEPDDRSRRPLGAFGGCHGPPTALWARAQYFHSLQNRLLAEKTASCPLSSWGPFRGLLRLVDWGGGSGPA